MKWSIKNLLNRQREPEAASPGETGAFARDITAYLNDQFGFGVWWLAEISSDEQFKATAIEEIPLCFAYGTNERSSDGTLNWRVGINDPLVHSVADVLARQTGFTGDITYEATLAAQALYDVSKHALFDAVEKSGLSARECCDILTAQDLKNRGKLPEAPNSRG